MLVKNKLIYLKNKMISKEEQKQIEQIESIYYMPPIISELNKRIEKVGLEKALDYSYYILQESKQTIEDMLDLRVQKKIIEDKSQARKSIVGAAFSNLIIYTFLKAKEKDLVNENIFITNKTKSFKNMVAIEVDGETQKPDMDLIIYSRNNDNSINKIMIISLKTSLRERAGQTYKWKLLLEIATTDNPIKKKYNIRYDVPKMPTVCFATVNFYNEIKNPQHRGMFKFFDNSFIGKPLNEDFIANLSELIPYANKTLV